MGLLKSGINEVIATTTYNAAPMGIRYHDDKAGMVVYIGSHTAENIERDGWVVANFTHDPVLFVKTAFGDLPRDAFVEECVEGRTMHRLIGADAWVAFTAVVEKKTSEVMMVRLTPLKEIIERVAVYPVNRGFGNLIDATVHATRYRMTRDPDLERQISYHAGLVRKCGGKQELQALEILLDYCK